MSIPGLRVLALVLLTGIVAVEGNVARAFADDERWVRHYRGGEIGGYDRALDLVVHRSGEITVVGLACNDLVVLRLDRTGKQLWSQVEPEEYDYASQVSAVASGEDAIVSATYYYPYGWTSADVYRYDRSGNTLWEQGASPISAMAEDGAGGAILVGHFYNDLGNNPGFVSRLASDGDGMWSHFVVPEDFPEEVYTGGMQVVAIQDSTYVYAAGSVYGPTMYRQVLAKYDMAGQLQWTKYVLPGDDSARVTWIGPASDGTSGVAGVDSTGAWLARRGADGEQLWIRSLPSLPILATDLGGVVYTATPVPDPFGGTNVLLTAIGPSGSDLWQAIYNSAALNSGDAPASLAVAHDGTIVLLAISDGQVVLLQYDPSGQPISNQPLGSAPPGGTSFVLDLAFERAFAMGGVADAVCCDASSDLFVASYDQDGAGPHVWTEFDRPMDALASNGNHVQVGADGSVTTAARTAYKCASSLDFVHYQSDGTLDWKRVHPETGLVAFNTSDQSTVACKRGGSIQLVRYDLSNSMLWNRSFQSGSDYSLEGLAPAPNLGVVLMDVVSVGTLLVAVDATGNEIWRRVLDEVQGRALTAGPDGRVYVQSWNENIEPRIHCLTSEGEVAWTQVLNGPERFVPLDLTAAEGGVFYVTGYVYRAGSNHWLTWRLGPDGSTQWTADEPAGAGNGNLPIRVRVHPAGGVVVAGTITGTTADAVLVRYDEQGVVQWRAGRDTPASERCVDMAIDPAGNALVTMAAGIGSARTVKYEPNGGVVWSREYFLGSGISYPMAIGVGLDLSVAVAGLAGGDSAITIKYEGPTPVEIARLDAIRNGEDVLVSWEVGAGLEPLGFNVLHGSAPDRITEQVNLERLPADARSFVHHAVRSGDSYYVLEVLELDGGSIRHGPVLASAGGAPSVFWATGPHPNPASEAVEWQVGLPAAGRLRLAVHDALGRTVAEVVDRAVPAGEHRVLWNGRLATGARAPAGIYFYRLTAGDETRTGKFVLSLPR